MMLLFCTAFLFSLILSFLLCVMMLLLRTASLFSFLLSLSLTGMMPKMMLQHFLVLARSFFSMLYVMRMMMMTLACSGVTMFSGVVMVLHLSGVLLLLLLSGAVVVT